MRCFVERQRTIPSENVLRQKRAMLPIESSIPPVFSESHQLIQLSLEPLDLQ